MSFDLSKVNEIKTVIKYTLLKFVDNVSVGNEKIVKVMRSYHKEIIKAPEYIPPITVSNEYTTYNFSNCWKNSANEIVADKNNKFLIEVPEVNTTYYANITFASIPKVAKILMTSPNTYTQVMVTPFDIIGSCKFYMKNASYYAYTIKPTCNHLNFGNSVKTTVTFIVDNFQYVPGVTITLNPEFILYEDSTCTKEIGKVNIRIDIESSSASTGD